MNNTKDLNVEEEILPLFDYTLNRFSQIEVVNILKSPLLSIEEIKSRQEIFNGFTANKKVLKGYFYYKIHLNEVYQFLQSFNLEDFPKNKLMYMIFVPKIEKVGHRSRFTQLILLFHRLHSVYFSKLSLSHFPIFYRTKVKEIYDFLSSFNLEQYELLIRENKFNNSNIIKLSYKISEMIDSGEIASFWNNLFLFEAYHSINQGILNNNFSFPEISKDKIKLKQFYHPLLENPIVNDFETSGNVIILNGANMSGKSTFLKAISICVFLGNLGIGIPAKNGEIPFISSFSIAINRKDDILKGYSHFMTEIVNLKSVVQDALEGKRVFAVFDELFSGTNVEDAFDISKTTIKGLSKFDNSFFFISTHNQQLKEFKNEKVSSYYIDSDIVDKTPTFTYKIMNGWSDTKVGRILFDNEGLNDMLS